LDEDIVRLGKKLLKFIIDILFYCFAMAMAMTMTMAMAMPGVVEVVKILGEGVIMNLMVLIKTPPRPNRS
jgi:hypothetical protein